MHLQAFIVEQLDALAEDWAHLASGLPGCAAPGTDALREHAAAMLRALADDPGDVQAVARQLARLRPGPGPGGQVAGLCALRSAVIRRWAGRRQAAAATAPDPLVRFHEGIDRAIADALSGFLEALRLRDQRDADLREFQAHRLAEAQAGARRAEELLASALGQARVGSWEWDAGTDGVAASPTMLELLGLPPDAPVLTGARLNAIVLAEDRAAHWRHRPDAARTPGEWRTHQYRVLRPSDGRLAWLEERVAPAGADASHRTLSGLTWHIRLRKQAEAALLEADRRKDRFLATLAHELRNPLAPIAQAAAVALGSQALPAPVRTNLEVIVRQSRQLACLLDDLLDVARMAKGQLQLRRGAVDAAEVVRSALETAMPQIAAGRHPLRLRLPEHPLELDGDALRLSQVVANLLTNAARYSAPGGPIEVALSEDARTVRIVVADQGNGIAPDQLEAVFQMFRRGAAPGALGTGGLGVGLALARELVQLHGGTLQARSEGPGRGASFCVRLPRVAGRAAPDEPAAGQAVRPARILVVDDNVDAADSLALLLRAQGHDVRVAYGGEAALALAAGFAPEIVLLDLGMPGLDGFAVARRLRQDRTTALPKLVAVSGWGQPSDRRRSADAGFDHHLTKPVDPGELWRLFAALQAAPGPDGAA